MAGGVFHITSRGDRKEDIYVDNDDRRLWLSILSKVCCRKGWICHSYCLMGNHYHLLLETPQPNLSEGMRDLNGIYAQAFNRRYGLVGHLFQDRFKSILVEKESYLLELARYVPLNPVRVNMVQNVEDWPWSSYPQMIGLSPTPPWLETKWILGQFHEDLNRARELFIDFVASGIDRPSVWKNLRGGFVLGCDTFVRNLSRQLSEIEENADAVLALRKYVSPSLEEIDRKAISSRAAILEAYSSGGYTMKEIARHFNVHPRTVSRTVRDSVPHNGRTTLKGDEH